MVKLVLVALLLSLITAVQAAPQPELRIPRRRPDAVGGSEFARTIQDLPLQVREERIWREVTAGNVPDFLRKLIPVPVSAVVDGRTVSGRFFVAPDYLAVGSDNDYLFVPLTPYTAQRLASRLRCTLPTPKMVDEIYAAAMAKLTPSPIPPSPAMTTVAVFVTHNATVYSQRLAALSQAPLGSLVAGDKKDIVICKALRDTPGHVAIYGWHKSDGNPIQPLYLGHVGYWADYSHGTRLIDETMEVGARRVSVARVLGDPKLCVLLSVEGPIEQPEYRFAAFPQPDDPTIHLPADERLESFSPVSGVRIMVDEPSVLKHRIRLVLFALPNGNTIEQTFGRRLRPGDDWHYDIQHIGAQTRFLRALSQSADESGPSRPFGIDEDESLVVAYLEVSNHAWPAWLRAHGGGTATTIYDAVVARFSGHEVRVALDSHSGGGAFLFDYLGSAGNLPPQIDRIAFIDSEYDYESALHRDKLVNWLAEPGHFLCTIAYDDASARYEGKPFVTAEGGTWGRSHAMLSDLQIRFDIRCLRKTDPERYEGLQGRIVFLFKGNPKAQILHTIQVERNGFVESLLSGTAQEGCGYEYFGPRAYNVFVK